MMSKRINEALINEAMDILSHKYTDSELKDIEIVCENLLEKQRLSFEKRLMRLKQDLCDMCTHLLVKHFPNEEK